MTDGQMSLCAPKAPINGHNRITGNGRRHSQPAHLNQALDVITAEWTCKKRDGKLVPFDVAKVRRAVASCFSSVVATKETMPLSAESTIEPYLAVANVEKVVRGVVYAMAVTQDPETGVLVTEVETVQRFVIQQLWANMFFEQAEHYQNYREEHRKRRINNPVSVEVQNRFDGMQKHFPTDLQIYQFMSKFARWNSHKQRRETWDEAVRDRVMPWFKKTVRSMGFNLTEEEWADLDGAMYGLDASPAMRVLQMAGPALDRCHVGAFNCAYAPVSDLFAFPEALYILMQGTGHGFSCENDYVSKLPRIAKQRGGKLDTIVVQDSTEGWCDAYYTAIQRWVEGYDADFDVSKVRKKNTILKTKGGRASGPEPFLELMNFARNVFTGKQGRFLEDTDVHRLMCFTGRIVQVGGVRRAAMMSLSDLQSQMMRGIKSGNWWGDRTYWQDGKYLSMSNNSAVYDFDALPPIEVFTEEWLALIKSKSGERGIFNRRAAELCKPARRQGGHVWGCNPCAEIILRPFEFCNLSMAIARPHDTVESLRRKVRLAAYFGMLQCLCTDFRYIRPEWKKNCQEERLLGVDVTGQADCPLLQFGAPGREELQRLLKADVADVEIMLSRRWGINRPAADTTLKPGGDSSVFFNCGSGLTDRYAAYYWRWVRESQDSPVAKFLIDSGVPYAPAPEAPEALYVFGFPVKAPEGSTLRDSKTAVDQFHNWLQWKENYAEHSVSTTIYAEEHEWLALGAEVYKEIDKVTGVAFLPKDNGNYRYAPNEEITKEQYDQAMLTFPKLNWSKLTHFEETDQTSGSMSYACVGDKCEIG